MKGKVLGFDAAGGTGAISGENGQRYSFTAAEFKSPAPAKPNDNVDFEVDGGNAKNVYVTAAAMPNVDLAAMASNPAIANILAKPYVIWSAIIILGSLIAGYLSALSFLGQMSGPFGSGLGFTAILLALLFFIPVLAGVLIFFEYTNNPMTQLARLVTGVAATVAPILIPLIAGSAGGFGEVFGAFGVASDFFGFSITPGKLLTVGGGVLILLTYFGIIKKLG